MYASNLEQVCRRPGNDLDLDRAIEPLACGLPPKLYHDLRVHGVGDVPLRAVGLGGDWLQDLLGRGLPPMGPDRYPKDRRRAFDHVRGSYARVRIPIPARPREFLITSHRPRERIPVDGRGLAAVERARRDRLEQGHEPMA